jgi:predicted DNA-binding transcriptional regulator AlpA
VSSEIATTLKATDDAAPLLLDPEGVYLMLGIKRTKFYSLVRTGMIPPPTTRLGPRSPRWSTETIREWVKAGCPRPDEGGRRK